MVCQRPDVPADQWILSPAGLEAAAELANHPDVLAADEVYSSPEPKAVATAIALAGDRRVLTLDSLRELDRGALGWVATAGEYSAIVEQILLHPDASLRGCERAADATDRMMDAIATITAPHPSATVVAVSHGIVLTLLISSMLRLPQPSVSMWRSIRFPDIAVVDSVSGRLIVPFGGTIR
jgi:broad specificity phosphatase PhoE